MPPLLSDRERDLAEALAGLTYSNPFLPERLAWERRVLGSRFVATDAVWHPGADPASHNPNLEGLTAAAEALAADLRERLARGAAATPAERRRYRDVVYYTLYQRYEGRFFAALTAGGAAARGPMPFFRSFAADLDHFLGERAPEGPAAPDAAHLFAVFFQVRRAFHLTFHFLVGRSLPVARLRAAVWQSTFTHDLDRYLRSLYRVMGDLTTLVTGPSGTGKELVARAIGLARYIPFDPASRSFAESFEESFFPLNLSALSPTLIESELFGHRRGSFTGAVEDRSGWFEVCPPLGTVFLDEIGDLDPAVQVKILRVLESRSFTRLGETAPRRFQGKVVAATNRDLAAAMRRGRFREDLYYRLCGDVVRTPSLAERLAGAPEELVDLALVLARQVVGPEEAEAVAAEVVAWIDAHLGPAYPWPGNVRELGQCVRNLVIRRDYRPAEEEATAGPAERLAREVGEGALTAEELLARYTTLVYARAGSYQEAARRLGLDRRTVKARVDREMLAELGGEAPPRAGLPPPGV